MAYMLTVEDANAAENEAIELEPPRQGYALYTVAPKRNDEVILVWRNPDVTDVEVSDLDRLCEAVEAIDLDDAGTPEVEK